MKRVSQNLPYIPESTIKKEPFETRENMNKNNNNNNNREISRQKDKAQNIN